MGWGGCGWVSGWACGVVKNACAMVVLDNTGSIVVFVGFLILLEKIPQERSVNQSSTRFLNT